MRRNVKVTPEYLEGITAIQTTAATDVGDAEGKPAGTGESCWWNHGLICWTNNAAFVEAEAVRSTASDALAGLCERLGYGLSVANESYGETDANQGRLIGGVKFLRESGRR